MDQLPRRTSPGSQIWLTTKKSSFNIEIEFFLKVKIRKNDGTWVLKERNTVKTMRIVL